VEVTKVDYAWGICTLIVFLDFSIFFFLLYPDCVLCFNCDIQITIKHPYFLLTPDMCLYYSVGIDLNKLTTKDANKIRVPIG
jgi:hypothetical protein